jgi:hypothetical protein
MKVVLLVALAAAVAFGQSLPRVTIPGLGDVVGIHSNGAKYDGELRR